MTGEQVASFMGTLKEGFDVTVCFATGLQWYKVCHSASQRSDWEDNELGRSCPLKKKCWEQCEQLKNAPDTDPGLFGD